MLRISCGMPLDSPQNIRPASNLSARLLHCGTAGCIGLRSDSERFTASEGALAMCTPRSDPQKNAVFSVRAKGIAVRHWHADLFGTSLSLVGFLPNSLKS